MRSYSRLIPIALLCAIAVFIAAPAAQAFCGFFVAKADAKLYNSASRVTISHQGDRSIFLMSNNYEGNVENFARIVPIPVIPQRDRVRIGNAETIDRLDSYTAPRLAVYQNDPCRQEYETYAWVIGFGIFVILGAYYVIRGRSHSLSERVLILILAIAAFLIAIAMPSPSFLYQANKAKSRGYEQATVVVEDRFTVGEYDVTILSAEESNGLTEWLRGNGYKVPDEAVSMLQSYIDNDMKFFVVRVNLEKFEKLGTKFLRPIVLDYQSPKFMLPIRLGTLNAKGLDQDLIITILSPDGYVEVENYQTLTIPTDAKSHKREVSGEELPALVKNNFGDFYKALFQKEYERVGKKAVFLEYAGNTEQCDPCSDRPLNPEILNDAGVFWQGKSYITRLHVRYNKENFPQDLHFWNVSPDALLEKIKAENKFFYNKAGVVFQGRYVIREVNNLACFSGVPYWNLKETEMANLKRLTGWSNEEIKQKVAKNVP